MNRLHANSRNLSFAIVLGLLIGLCSFLFVAYVSADNEPPIVVDETFDDLTVGDTVIPNWTFTNGVPMSVEIRPDNGSDTGSDELLQSLKSSSKKANTKAIKTFKPLEGKIEITYDFRVEGRPNGQIKLPEINGLVNGGKKLLTSISAVAPTAGAEEDTFRFSIPVDNGTARVYKDNVPLKTWVSMRVEIDTDTDKLSVWVDDELLVNNRNFYNGEKPEALATIEFFPTTVDAPDFYIDNLVIKGEEHIVIIPDVRDTKLAVPPAIPMVPSIKKEHPRILINGFDGIKAKLASDYIPMQWYNRIKKRADELLTMPVRPFGANPNNNGILEHAREMENRTFILSLVYQMEKKQEYLDRLWLEIENTASYPTWQPSSFLSVAEMLLAYSIAYDWNYYDWTPTQRQFIVDTMLDKGLTHAVDAYNGNHSGTNFVNAQHNWNPVCNASLIMAAIAIADDYPDLTEFILEKASSSMANGLKAYTGQGGYPEGAMYWAYGTNFLTYAMSVLDTAFEDGFELPGKYKLYEAPGVAETAEFPIYISGTVGSFNYGDSSLLKPNSPLMMWFAQKFDKPQYAWYFLKTQEEEEAVTPKVNANRDDVYSIIWYDSSFSNITASFPLDKSYKNEEGVNAILMRSSWQNKNGIYVGLKGGYNRENHSALSIGTFVLDALGERWATMRGPGNYNWPSYNDRTGGRYQYYVTRAEGQNTLVINPDNGFDQDIHATGRVIDFQANAAEAFGTMDMSAGYASDASSVKRGVRLFDNRSKVLIQDEMTVGEDSEIWWFMHTSAEIKISGDGQSAMLTMNGKKMWVNIADGPAHAAFYVMEAKPLPLSPNPSVQVSVYGKKLAIRMQGSGTIRLAVEFVPLNEGEAPPVDHATIVNMSEWSLTEETSDLLAAKLGSNVALFTDSPLAYAKGTRSLINEISTNVKPSLTDGEQWVPVQYVTQQMGGQVQFDAASNVIIINYRDRVVVLPYVEPKVPTDPTNPGFPIYSNGPTGSNDKDGSRIVLDEQALKAHDGKISIMVEPVPDSTAYEIVFPADIVAGLDANSELAITTAIGSIHLPASVLLNAEAGEELVLIIEEGDRSALGNDTTAAIGNRPLVKLGLKREDGSSIDWSSDEGKMTISIPYSPSPQEEENPEHIVIWSLGTGTDGKPVAVPSGKYDAATGIISFTLHHLHEDTYAVAYVIKTFDDMVNYGWASKEISVLASKGIINGTSESTFDPASSITRADFIMLLVKTLNLTATVDGNFEDIGPDDYFYEAVAIARKLGISNGVGGNKFAPKEQITRQDMMALAARAMKLAGMDLPSPSGDELSGYMDSDQVSPYAADAVSILIQLGVIKGDGDNIHSGRSTSRAEAAVMLYRIYNM